MTDAPAETAGPNEHPAAGVGSLWRLRGYLRPHLGSLVVMAFSRWREFRADAGSARLGGRENMIRALQALLRDAGIAAQVPQAAVQTLRISSPGGVTRLFMSHPPLEERIARLQEMRA